MSRPAPTLAAALLVLAGCAPAPEDATAAGGKAGGPGRPGALALAVDDAAAGEAGPRLQFIVRLSEQVRGKPVVVSYATADETADAGADYESTSGTLTFSGNATEHVVTVDVIDDGADEPDEMLRLRATVTGQAERFEQDEAVATGTIVDDDVPPPPPEDLGRWVDPRIGSFPPGFTNPGAVVPFGMVALGPDTEGPINYGGYYFHNALVSGFSHVHLSAGVYKGGYIPVLPFTGARTLGDLPDDHPFPAYASSFDHASEVAEPGYYAVTLTRYGVRAEFTATERAGLHRYTFNDPTRAPRVLVDVGRTLGSYRPAAVGLRDDGAVVGRVETGRFPVFFAARFSRPFTTATTFAGVPLAPGETTPTAGGVGVELDFDDPASPVLAKIGISYTDEEGALRNLDAELPPGHWDFDAVRSAARTAWNAALSRILVEGGTDAEKASFYTALYRLQHFPNLHSDVDGRYRGPDGRIHADARPHYSQFSSWDSYRGQNQMQAEIIPERYGDMVRSLLAFHEQSGALPKWQEGPVDAGHMSGNPIIPFIGEAWCRGQLDEALRAELWPALQNLVARREPDWAALGYVPVPAPDNPVEQLAGGPRGAGTTLEYGIADFALALMAQSAAGADAAAIAQRSLSYRRLLDSETRWVRPRHADGSWLTPFAPELGYGFQEGTSWQYSWLAMHDYAGLIAGMGGDAAVDRRLDVFFNFPAAATLPIAWPTVQNQATVFGIAYYGNQYAPGNEHDLEAPYVYHYAGAPWKSQAIARAAASIYTPAPNGLPGNDDLGALSGWLLWTMSGLYPMNPGAPLAVVGSPVFEKVTLRRPGGDLVIEAPGAAGTHKYVQSVELDGVAQERSWLLLPRSAATIRLAMGAAPNPAFGVAASARPPSLSTHGLAPFGCSAAPRADPDGVADGDDQCPGAASLVNQHGCPLAAQPQPPG